MKWLITLSRAVNRTSPMTLPLCKIGWVTGCGNSQWLIIPLIFRSYPARYSARWRLPSVFITYFCNGKLPLLAQRRQRFSCRDTIRKDERCFKRAGHGCCSQIQVLLRILPQCQHGRYAEQQPDQRHGYQNADYADTPQCPLKRRACYGEWSLSMLIIPCKHQYVWTDPYAAAWKGIHIYGKSHIFIFNYEAKSAANNAFGILFSN